MRSRRDACRWPPNHITAAITPGQQACSIVQLLLPAASMHCCSAAPACSKHAVMFTSSCLLQGQGAGEGQGPGTQQGARKGP